MEEKTVRQEVLDALEAGNLYDFIASNYHRLDNFELAEIIKELDYVIFSQLGEPSLVAMERSVKEQLIDCGWNEK